MITVSPERGLGVVQVEARKAIEAHLGVELIDHLSERRGRADLEPGGEQVAGVETDADPRVTVEQRDELGELVEVSSQRPLGAGGVLEQHRAAVGIRQGGVRSPSPHASSTVRAARPFELRRAGRRHGHQFRRRPAEHA